MDWIVTGSSHTGREWTRRLIERWPDAVTMTTNRGIRWYEEEGWPLDYIFVFDMVACEEYRDAAYRLRERDGTRLVTLDRKKDVLERRGVDKFDEFIGPGRFRCKPDWFKRGEWNDMALSGLWSAQYALNGGATTLHLPGHEGYRGKPTDYEDGKPHPSPHDKTLGIIEPGFKAMYDACPDVEFVFYGDLAYSVAGTNVTRILKHVEADSQTEAAC